mgnify:CR=1 FL=1
MKMNMQVARPWFRWMRWLKGSPYLVSWSRKRRIECARQWTRIGWLTRLCLAFHVVPSGSLRDEDGERSVELIPLQGQWLERNFQMLASPPLREMMAERGPSSVQWQKKAPPSLRLLKLGWQPVIWEKSLLPSVRGRTSKLDLETGASIVRLGSDRALSFLLDPGKGEGWVRGAWSKTKVCMILLDR